MQFILLTEDIILNDIEWASLIKLLIELITSTGTTRLMLGEL